MPKKAEPLIIKAYRFPKQDIKRGDTFVVERTTAGRETKFGIHIGETVLRKIDKRVTK